MHLNHCTHTQDIQDSPNKCPPITIVGTKVDLCDEGKREVSTESGEKLAAELGDSFDKQPLKPETKLPKKTKHQKQPQVNLVPDIAYIETSAKLNKNIEGVSPSPLSCVAYRPFHHFSPNLCRFFKTLFEG